MKHGFFILLIFYFVELSNINTKTHTPKSMTQPEKPFIGFENSTKFPSNCPNV